MTLEKIISKLNWRQVIIHFIAFCLFIYAFQTFSYLHNTTLIEVVRNSKGRIPNTTFIDNNISSTDLMRFLLWTNISPLVGLLISFFMAIMISKKRAWFWVNSLLAFLVAYFLLWNHLLGWDSLKQTLMTPGKIFSNAIVEVFSRGIILLLIGLLFFYLKPITRFLEYKKLPKA